LSFGLIVEYDAFFNYPYMIPTIEKSTTLVEIFFFLQKEWFDNPNFNISKTFQLKNQ
jgi:hypothetical protein